MCRGQTSTYFNGASFGTDSNTVFRERFSLEIHKGTCALYPQTAPIYIQETYQTINNYCLHKRRSLQILLAFADKLFIQCQGKNESNQWEEV